MLGRIVLLRHKHKSQKVLLARIISGSDIPAFSFFRWIFLNDKQLGSPDKDLILAHEMAHARQAHSVDLVLAEIIQVFLWFNPFIILYKKALKECHEFLADAAVLSSGVLLPIYARSLQKEVFIGRYQKLASYFRGSTLKRRMIMATKNDNRRSVWNYLLVIPLLAIALSTFSFINDPIQFPSNFDKKKGEFVILIDPAHGGEDPGSVNDSLGIYEKDIVLEIAKYLRKTAPKDLKIILTRDSDEFVSGDERIRMAANPDVDMIISLQLGKLSNPGIIASFFTSYSPLNAYSDQSKVLSAWFDEKYIFNSQSGYKTPQQIPDQILSKTECPGFLLKLGNFNNNTDLAYLSETRNHKIIANNIHVAIKYVRQQIAVGFPDGQIEKIPGYWNSGTNRLDSGSPFAF